MKNIKSLTKDQALVLSALQKTLPKRILYLNNLGKND